MFIEVKNGVIVGELFNLDGTHVAVNGTTIFGVNNASKEELLALGLFEVIENMPPFNAVYQSLTNRVLAVKTDFVEMTYDVINNTAAYDNLVQQRLNAFANEKYFDQSEVDKMLNSGIQEWIDEATKFTDLWAKTWQAFYAATSTDWIEIESTLPVLSWS